LSGSPGREDALLVLEWIHGAVVLEFVWHFFLFSEKCTRSW
jgi:hypothetical protein